MSSTTLSLLEGATAAILSFDVERLILAGYTGRDRSSVQRHIDELAAQGVPPPERVPILYPGLASSIQVDGSLPAGAGRASGEVEFVLLVGPDTTYVGVGSDHTDRDMEQTSIVDSKRAFPKILGQRVWPLALLERGWDGMMLRSWVTHEGTRRLYQEGPVASMMTPAELLALIPPAQQGAGLVLFSGTVPAASEAPSRGHCHFEGELVSAEGGILTSCAYDYRAR
jgi:uncharacterized protein DUF2848